MRQWRTRSRRTVLDLSPWVSVETHVVELPDGQVIEDWPWLESRDYVNVVALTEDERFLFFRQTKYAVDGTTLAPIGGYLEPGEEPLATARRELLEESGYEAEDWTRLGQYVVDGNRGFGVGHLYLARGARHVADPAADDLEEQQLLTLTRAEVENALTRGEFKVMSWAAVVALALLAVASEREGSVPGGD
jgi:ADP-ribose pyrophosphatase